MQVQITYNDSDSLTVEEVKKLAKRNYGDGVKLEVRPNSSAPTDLIYFAIQQMITHRQVSMLFDNSVAYNSEILKLRKDTIDILSTVLDQVILDNEARVQ